MNNKHLFSLCEMTGVYNYVKYDLIMLEKHAPKIISFHLKSSSYLKWKKKNVNLRMSGPAGYKPCYKKWQRGGAAGPRRVVESHSQNQGPSGASREGVSQPVHSALCNADQVFQTGTTCRVDLHLIVAQY